MSADSNAIPYLPYDGPSSGGGSHEDSAKEFTVKIKEDTYTVRASSQRDKQTVGDVPFTYHAIQLFQSIGNSDKLWKWGYWMPEEGVNKWKVVEDDPSGRRWKYGATTGKTKVGEETVHGEWIELEFPISRRIDTYTFIHRYAHTMYWDVQRGDLGVPTKWRVFGSDDGELWDEIGTEVTHPWAKWKSSASNKAGNEPMLKDASYESSKLGSSSRNYRRLRFVFTESSHQNGFRLDRILIKTLSSAPDTGSIESNTAKLDAIADTCEDDPDSFLCSGSSGDGDEEDEDGEDAGAEDEDGEDAGAEDDEKSKMDIKPWVWYVSGGLLLFVLLMLLMSPPPPPPPMPGA